jgi:biotin carboxyl carrier protein
MKLDGTGASMGTGDTATVSMLGLARWRNFLAADEISQAAPHWLVLQALSLPGAVAGVLVLSDGRGAYAPAAYWPESRSDPGESLAGTVEVALAEGRSVTRDAPDGGFAVACPVVLDAEPVAAVGFSFSSAAAIDRRDALHQLRWGAGWIEALIQRRRAAESATDAARVESIAECLAVALDETGFQQMAEAVAIDLALRVDCELVAIGFRDRGSSTVRALSHASDFRRRMNLVRDIAAAMDEAIDQACLIRHPADGSSTVNRAHAELAREHKAAALLTVPFAVGDRLAGAFTFERREGVPFDRASMELLDCIVTVLGPVLEQARREDRALVSKAMESGRRQLARLLGPLYVGRKLALGALVVLVALGATVEHDFQIVADARVEGSISRVIAAPFEGYIAETFVSAGDVVEEGSLLARLDDRDLTLDRLLWTTTARQRETEYGRALASGDRAEATVIQAQIENAQAQIAMIDEQIARTRLTAPFAGIMVEGDLSQSIGASVNRGEALFTISPLDYYRVVLEVDERDIGHVAAGQHGELVVEALPGETLMYTVTAITPVNSAREGRNVFRVEGVLDADVTMLLPGMEGVAKTHAGRRLVAWSWTRRLREWLQLAVWRWSG